MSGCGCFCRKFGVVELFEMFGHRGTCNSESIALNGFSLVLQIVKAMGICWFFMILEFQGCLACRLEMFPVNCIGCRVVSHTCVWRAARRRKILGQKRLYETRVIAKQPTEKLVNFRPMLTHVARWILELAMRGKPSTLFPRGGIIELVSAMEESTIYK